MKRPLSGLRVGPFYGCYVVRPKHRLGYDEHPDRDLYLEQVIEALGGEVVEYDGARKCCGFPVITMNRETSLRQAGTHVGDALDAGADCLVTPCPLCHLNLDMQQPEAAKLVNRDLGLAVLHLPQLVGLALGLRAEGARATSGLSTSSARLGDSPSAGHIALRPGVKSARALEVDQRAAADRRSMTAEWSRARVRRPYLLAACEVQLASNPDHRHIAVEPLLAGFEFKSHGGIPSPSPVGWSEARECQSGCPDCVASRAVRWAVGPPARPRSGRGDRLLQPPRCYSIAPER